MFHRVFVGCLAATTLVAAAPYVRANEQPRQSSSKPTITTQMVTVTHGDARFSCYLARPTGDGPAPALLLIHDWWGLNEWVKRQADRFAEQGYIALAVDLYRGEVATDRDHAHELSRGLSDDRALADMKAAFDCLATHPSPRGKPVGVIGWCMGGGHALKLAIAEPKVACTVICYGRPVTDVEQLKKIRGPILGIWGATDRGIEVEPFKKALEQARMKATHHVYPGAGHAFLNEGNQRGYNKEQAQKAWAEIDGFLARHLAGAHVAVARASVGVHLAVDAPRAGYTAMSPPDSDRTIYVAPDAALTERDIASAQVVADQAGRWSISIQFSPGAVQTLAQLTKAHVGDHVAVLVDGRLIMAPEIMGEIKGGQVMVTGTFSREEAERIANSMLRRAGERDFLRDARSRIVITCSRRARQLRFLLFQLVARLGHRLAVSFDLS